MDPVDSGSEEGNGAGPPDARIGTRIGPYLIEALLGRGGMGIVYLAHDERLDRKVALKVLAPEWSEDDGFRDRFMRESRTAASLDHPNVIPVFEADKVEGLLFIAMRYVDGRDLKDIITTEGPLEMTRTIRILRQIGGALDAAHARELVHRDVKPANVLVTKDDGSAVSEHVYLTDFGLSKHRSSRSAHTAAGTFVGTIDYISPEQIEGKELDNRTDIYSLGCILYECLTGETPFQKETDVAVMYAHLMDPRPSVAAKRADLPSSIDEIAAKAMARQPDERYVTAAALLQDLDALPTASTGAGAVVTTRTEDVRSVPPEPEPAEPDEDAEAPARRGLSRRLVMLGALVTLALVGTAYFLMSGDDPAPSGTPKGGAVENKSRYAYFSSGDRGLERILIEAGAEPQPIKDVLPPVPKRLHDAWVAVSTNGEWFVMETERAGCEGYSCLVTTKDGTTLEAVQIGPNEAHTSGSGYSAISSDGKTIVYPSDKGPHEVDLLAITRARIGWSDPVLLTCDSTSVFNDLPVISADGSRVLFDCRKEVYEPAGGGICEVGIDGSGFKILIAADDGPGVTKESYVRHGSYAPDGSIVFEAFWKGFRQVWRYKAGGKPEPINPTYEEDTAPCVLVDGRILSLHEGTVKIMSPDGVDVEVLDVKLGEEEYLDNRLSCG